MSKGGDNYCPAVQAPLQISNAKVSIGLAQALYWPNDAKEDQGNALIRRLFRAVLRGNRWATAHAPTLLPAIEAVVLAADAACDAAMGTHLPGAVEALTEAEHQLADLLGAAGGLDALNENAAELVTQLAA